MVVIVDPHIKRDSGWRLFKEAEDKGLYVKNKDGADFDGCGSAAPACHPRALPCRPPLCPAVPPVWRSCAPSLGTRRSALPAAVPLGMSQNWA